MQYLARVTDRLLDDRLIAKGAVLIEGPKWCGKTTTAKKFSNSQILMDQPDRTRQYQDMAEINPQILLEGEVPRLIDEWQIAPNLWNAVRYEVDQRNEMGQFILTGSAVPPNLDESSHTGTGRISRLKMRTMSLFESQESSGQVALSSLFKGDIPSGQSQTTIRELAFWICRGGWPKSIALADKPALFQAIDYHEAIISQDISRVDNVSRDKEKVRRLLRSYARHIGSQSSYEVIRQDMLSNDIDTFDEKTLYSYLDALTKIFVIEDSPAWNPNLRSKAAIRTTDTRYFVDPSIAAASLGVGPEDLINDLNTMGFLFENLAIRDLRVYADSLYGDVYHYRDSYNLECDAVVHLRNGSYGLIEIKLGGESQIEGGAKTLLDLASKIDLKRMKSPSFLMVLCGLAPFAYKRKDGVLVVPISCLKD